MVLYKHIDVYTKQRLENRDSKKYMHAIIYLIRNIYIYALYKNFEIHGLFVRRSGPRAEPICLYSQILNLKRSPSLLPYIFENKTA